MTMDMNSMLLGQAIPIFNEWLNARGLSSETLRGYNTDLKQFHRWMSSQANGPVFVDELKRENIEEFVLFLKHERNCRPRSINRKLNSLSSFLTCMKKKKYVKENILEDYERVKVPDSERVYLNKEELESIIEAIDHPIIHSFVKMMANTGIRVNECIQLTLKDVNLEEGYIQVINGKGGKNRRVPMSKPLIEHMKGYLEKHRPETDSLYFFALKRTGTVSEQYVNRLLKAACEKTGIKRHVTSHILRHSFASYLVKNSTNVTVIQKLLGHANIRTTSVYLHVQQEDLQEAISKVDF